MQKHPKNISVSRDPLERFIKAYKNKAVHHNQQSNAHKTVLRGKVQNK
ncbi:MAG: sulfotransferase family protein [Ruminococcaceae bacterium]|nr:sulfotransferase family protein [Oscillospiraceae bacterium]